MQIAATASPQALAHALDIHAVGHRLAADLVWMAAEGLKAADRAAEDRD